MADKIHAMPGSNLYVFHCPGCGYGHRFEVPRWSWNGSLEKPTFSPSLLVNSHMPEQRCHLFMTKGRIQYLSDCHHRLAGQTVDVPDWENNSNA